MSEANHCPIIGKLAFDHSACKTLQMAFQDMADMAIPLCGIDAFWLLSHGASP
ncbi:hypothetical protein [Erythrobacter sp.]|uniref:hypothetical protein n=1 Tax=Erythrobacter sp. TaxID=1042 RepID=UPI00311EAE11